MNPLIKSTVFFIVVLYSSYAYLYFFNTGSTAIKPSYWYFFTIGIAMSFLVLKTSKGLPEYSQSIILWLLVFLANSIVTFLYSTQGEVQVEALTASFTATALLFSFLVLLRFEDAVRVSRLALLIVTLVATSMNIIDFITPMWSQVPGRAAGFYQNPNPAGTIPIFGMLFSFPFIPRKFRLAYCIFVGLGVFVTFSRGAWIEWVLAIAGLATIGYISIGRKVFSIITVSLIAVFFVYSALTGGVLSMLAPTGFDDYLRPGTLARLGGSGEAFSDLSYETRSEAALKAWDIISDHPWLGVGIGADQEWTVGVHNTYLRMAVEGGLVRLAVFLWLLYILWQKTDNTGRIALIVYAASCLTFHDNLRQPAFLLVIALIATTTNTPTPSKDNLLDINSERKDGNTS